ncbi:uncharacterized protein MONBRDRAFT_7375 [Monosiga brevicollis MX1]|uniref:Plastocyanin-like domain-containing protein n=1 Tax=Monosiga brevicollis TaxID=81824 RepID=A9UWS1_MONBE|nr:uncharacterized protein MONBRDRAFT_7375 [Monosiga brevicollis MX1]EDQ90264.1 predicted protein [Monosiga brevicollis MX1]|eukprot:XP_001745031.1 hypothetical protein [Monosiga brevicollis MX1]
MAVHQPGCMAVVVGLVLLAGAAMGADGTRFPHYLRRVNELHLRAPQQLHSSPVHNFKADRGRSPCCFIDLEGGEYRISRPIQVPIYTANMQLGPTFPTDQFMLIVGIPDSCNVPQGSCNLDLNFPALFMDGSHRASGCMQINHVMGVTIGPGAYFLNFSNYGVHIYQGHEVMMDRCWLGETNFDFDFVRFGSVPNATAIQIDGNDHYVLNTIVFSSRIGVAVNGAADYVSGVHVWFPMNADYGFATVVTRPANGCKVLAETDKAISGIVTIEVDTSALDPGFM